MADPQKKFRAAVLSVVKHDYLPMAVAAHPRFELVLRHLSGLLGNIVERNSHCG